LAGESFDVVHCFRLNTGLLRLLRRGGVSFARSVLDFDTYESHAEFGSIKAFGIRMGWIWSAVIWLNAMKLWILEALLIPHFDGGIVCSESDRQRLSVRFPNTLWYVVPNIVPEPLQFKIIRSELFTFIFVGLLIYHPNWDAVLFFCTRVLPILRREAAGQFRVLIVGRARDHGLEELTAVPEVQVVLDAPDLCPYYAQSDVAVVPIRGGGGTRVKILEAFSHGLPVVSTTIGAEGLEVTPDTDIVIADGAEAFAHQCLRVWKDDALRLRIAGAGRDLWRTKYSLPKLVGAFEAVYEGKVARTR
jgi:glycosyltransferase involved in cell wall biosynthesis